MENLHLLDDVCSVDYPMPDNPQRAILYRRSGGAGGEDENRNGRESSIGEEELRVRRELGRRLSNHAVPALQIPREEYPSVLVVEATNTNAVVLRSWNSMLASADAGDKSFTVCLSSSSSSPPQVHRRGILPGPGVHGG